MSFCLSFCKSLTIDNANVICGNTSVFFFHNLIQPNSDFSGNETNDHNIIDTVKFLSWSSCYRP